MGYAHRHSLGTVQHQAQQHSKALILHSQGLGPRDPGAIALEEANPIPVRSVGALWGGRSDGQSYHLGMSIADLSGTVHEVKLVTDNRESEAETYPSSDSNCFKRLSTARE